MKRSSRRDYLQKIYSQYHKSSTMERHHILDEFCTNCGYHRKYAIRLLNGPPPRPQPARRHRPRGATYGSRLISILRAVWEAADYPWSVRLKDLLPDWMPWIRQRFRLTAERRSDCCASARAASITGCKPTSVGSGGVCMGAPNRAVC
jgi:hypothetical protein